MLTASTIARLRPGVDAIRVNTFDGRSKLTMILAVISNFSRHSVVEAFIALRPRTISRGPPSPRSELIKIVSSSSECNTLSAIVIGVGANRNISFLDEHFVSRRTTSTDRNHSTHSLYEGL